MDASSLSLTLQTSGCDARESGATSTSRKPLARRIHIAGMVDFTKWVGGSELYESSGSQPMVTNANNDSFQVHDPVESPIRPATATVKTTGCIQV